MATGTAKLKLDFAYADDTNRSIEIPNLDADLDAAALKTKIKALDVDAISDTFVSDAGAALSALAGAQLVKITETEIKLKTE